MATSIGLVVLGLLLLVGGGELLLRGAVSLAMLARVTPAVIGLTVVAAGTSLPELAVSLIAALKGSEAVAIGNVVGSCIFNITFIVGLAALIRPIVISGNTLILEYPVLVFVTVLFLFVSADGSIGRLDAGFFVAFYVGFTAYMVVLVRRQLTKSETKDLKEEVKELAKSAVRPSGAWSSVLLVVVGVALLVGGAQATVTGAVEVGRFFGMTESVIGLTIVAVGTGLPEVVTTLVSSARGRADVAIGNVIGSNLFNILGTLGICGLIRPVAVPSEIIGSDKWWLLGVTLLLLPLLSSGRRVARWEGVVLLVAYGAYLAILLRHAGVI